MPTIVPDRSAKIVLLGSYAILTYAVAVATLTSTRTNGSCYERVAAGDPTGLVNSNVGRGLYTIGRTVLAAVCSPIVALDYLGKSSRR